MDSILAIEAFGTLAVLLVGILIGRIMSSGDAYQRGRKEGFKDGWKSMKLNLVAHGMGLTPCSNEAYRAHLGPCRPGLCKPRTPEDLKARAQEAARATGTVFHDAEALRRPDDYANVCVNTCEEAACLESGVCRENSRPWR